MICGYRITVQICVTLQFQFHLSCAIEPFGREIAISFQLYPTLSYYGPVATATIRREVIIMYIDT